MTAPDRFMVMSADCRAGLPNAEYNEWLDPSLHDAFDKSPTAADLGHDEDRDLSKWDNLREAGRPWIIGIESFL